MPNRAASQRFTVSHDFVVAHAVPTAEELKYGYLNGWLAERDVVRLSVVRACLGLRQSDAEERVMLLLEDELGRLPELLGEFPSSPASTDAESQRFWLFIASAWVVERGTVFSDQCDAVNMLYADLGYPSEMEALVSYMPTSPGVRSGENALRDRWAEFIRCRSAAYTARTKSMMRA